MVDDADRPLLPPGAEVDGALRGMGLRRQPICPMDSALLSLDGSDEKLMMGLNEKWRNCLRKGQKLGVMVKLDDGGREHFQWLIDFYRAQQREKRFDGTSDRMLQALAANQSRSFKFNLYVALDGSGANQASMMGVLVALQFGDVSEYLIGATNEGACEPGQFRVAVGSHPRRQTKRLPLVRCGRACWAYAQRYCRFQKGLNPEPYALVGGVEEMVLKATVTMNGMMQRSRRMTIGINDILRLCNGVVACLILSGFFLENLADHPYMDWLTLVLGLVLCLQTHIALRLERRNPDPFVLVMAYLLTFFYALRIFTLLLYPVQDVFLRYAYGPADSNHALLYILIANTFIYAGFFQVNLRGAVEIETGDYQPRRPRIGVALLVISLLFGLLVQKQLPDAVAPFINLIYNNFFTPNVILMVLAIYVIVFRNRLPSIYIKIVLGSAAILMVLQTLAFSRSGLLTLADNLLIVGLALLPTVRLSRRYVLVGFAVVPFLLITAFTIYSISTTTRQMKGEAGGNAG